MAGDATPPSSPPPPAPELPPGLLAEYLESARAQLGVLAGLAEPLVARGGARGAGAATPHAGSTAAGVPTPRGAACANRLSPVASETGDALARRAGGARRRIGRRRPRAGGDLRRGRRGARRAARVRVTRARVSVFGVS